MQYVKFINELSEEELYIVGNKVRRLNELINMGLPVPEGFVILPSAFQLFLEINNLNTVINRQLSKINSKNFPSIKKLSENFKNSILKSEIPKEIVDELLYGFKKLKTKYVAVRSSAVLEDSSTISLAGVLETYLNTRLKDLIHNIKKCWASFYNPISIFYVLNYKKCTKFAILVQKMISARVSGVCFTVHPVIKNRNYMIIEAVKGLGDLLVSNKATPDFYIIDKISLKIVRKNINIQKKYM
jgi:pyruvate, water dikinase